MDKQQVRLFPGRYDQIRNICDFVLQGAEAAGLDETAVFHVELACDEACTNIIEHAYGGEDQGQIKIGWGIDGPWFVITIGDQGSSFDPDAVPRPKIPSPGEPAAETMLENLPVGGLGIHFMRKLMDVVEFNFDDKDGNTLLMKKKRA